ncbi:MAG: YbaK/EbsC family protein [Bacteroidales bacterium]|nr:YbaK/EbsC family protein [Bacteroidales bacterium]
MPIKKLKEFLDSHEIEYLTIHHSIAYSAQKIAAKTHIPGKELAKTIMVKVDGKLAMAVLPASYNINFSLLKEAIKAEKVVLASEFEFKDIFPQCEVGAMPPFGNLYNMEVYVAESLAEDEEICFNAGTHMELVRLAYKDFERLVKPKVLKFSSKRH